MGLLPSYCVRRMRHPLIGEPLVSGLVAARECVTHGCGSKPLNVASALPMRDAQVNSAVAVWLNATQKLSNYKLNRC